jgi:thiol-disulfide isomerase/thioredoxin
MKKRLHQLLPLLLLFSSCDKVKNPYLKTVNNGNDTTITKVRKVLVEDYTGHFCGNCPSAAITLQQLRTQYGSKLVTMGVHVGFYAEPNPLHSLPSCAPPGSFTTDFRTTAGNNYNTQFGNDGIGLPNGMVNRVTVSGSNVIPNSNWGTVVAGIINTPPDAYMQITTTYSSGMLNTTVKSQFLNPLSGTYNLVVLLTQDSIVDWQEDYTITPNSCVQNYVHRHVLRGAINGAGSGWGDSLTTNPIAGTGFLTKTYSSYTLNPAWNIAQCYVVAFIYNTSTYEVVQAEERKIQ